MAESNEWLINKFDALESTTVSSILLYSVVHSASTKWRHFELFLLSSTHRSFLPLH